MDLLEALVPILGLLLRIAPQFIDDAKRLMDALRTHPDPAIQPGAAHIEAALNGFIDPTKQG